MAARSLRDRLRSFDNGRRRNRIKWLFNVARLFTAATAMLTVSRSKHPMIRPSDFDIEIGQSERGTFVRVTHKPTGNHRCVDPVAPDAVSRTRDTLIAELRRLLFNAEDIRLDTGRAQVGDFIRVVHLPSGIERTAMRRDSSHDELLDAVLEELFARENSVGVTANNVWPLSCGIHAANAFLLQPTWAFVV